MRVAIAGARLAEFSCAKHLTNTRYISVRLERQGVLGEKVVAWAVQGFLLRGLSRVENKVLRADLYVSARSVDKVTLGRQACCPSQGTPIPNFYLMGDYTMQCYLASMEGAVLSGKLTAQAIAQAYPLSDTPASGEASL